MTIGEKIQNLRIEKGLTQERLAELLDVSRQSISKWELGQTVPEVDKIIRMSELFDVTTDEILLKKNAEPVINDNPLHLGSVYLVVTDFEKSVQFYEKFFGVSITNRCASGNQFVEFYIDNKCISLMDAKKPAKEGNIVPQTEHYKFVQNYWVEDLRKEHARVKELNIGKTTEILQAHPTYHYFHLRDPDNNVIEVTGGMNLAK